MKSYSEKENFFISNKNVKIGKNVFIGKFCIIQENTRIGKNTKIFGFCNLYGCKIGENCKIGPFTEIQKNVKIGNNCKIQSHTFICEGVEIQNGVFIGHNVVFINDKIPRAINKLGHLKKENEWSLLKTKICEGASIGSGAIILPVKIGKFAMIGAGSVVTKDIPPFGLAYGVPAQLKGFVCYCGRPLKKIIKITNKEKIYQCECGEKIIIKSYYEK